jgi:hypothetical protein
MPVSSAISPKSWSLQKMVRVGCARLVLSTVSSFLWAGSRGVATLAGPFLYLTLLLYMSCTIFENSIHYVCTYF